MTKIVKTPLQQLPNGMCYIPVAEKTVELFLKNEHKRVIAVINKIHELHCAFLHFKEGDYYIVIGSKVCKLLQLKVGDVVSVFFKKDTTEHQFEMPIELAEVLLQDETANTIWQSLTDGNKRSIMYLISLVKSTDKKIERAIKIADKLKAGITPIINIL